MQRRTVIRRAAEANINLLEVTGRGRSLQVCVGSFDDAERFRELVASWSMLTTQGEHVYLRPSVIGDRGDPMDKTSAHHH